MKTKTLAAGAVLAAAASMLAVAPGAQAQTPATLTVTAVGTLGISAPTTEVDLGSLAAGVTATDAPSALGTVAVTDGRTGLLNTNWIASVSSSSFVSDSTSTPITAANIGYKPGTITSTDVVKPVGTPLLALGATALPTVTRSGVGTNSASWSPVLTFTIGGEIVAGTYKGTITHSVL